MASLDFGARARQGTGKPAGVHAARMSAWNEAVMIGTGAVILAGVGILVSRNSSAALTTPHFDSNAVPVSPSTP